MGIVLGTEPSMQLPIPIDDSIDPSSIRTSQRAELLAAIHGLHIMAEYEACDDDESDIGHADLKGAWIVTSDSEYVVSGMTEWVPNWKCNGWRNPHGKRPENLDLFQTLDAAVQRYEQEHDVRIAFWHIRRDYNHLADSMAGLAARQARMMVDSESYLSESEGAFA